MSSVLLLDISRLIWRARRRGPTGIDRVELAYAQHFIAGGGERPAYAVLHLLGFVFAVSPAGGRRFIEKLAARWAGSDSPNRWGGLNIVSIYWQLLTSRWLFGPALRRALRAHPGTPLFMVVSHHHVARAHTVERIQSSLGVRTVCLIHDLIPIDYPEYFKRGWESRYRRLVSTVGQCFDAVIANSDSTARSLRACLQREPGTSSLRPAIRTAPLGVRAFPPAGGTHSRATEQRPYFVVLGTIEPRKNHLLLLNLWARLSALLPLAPRLLVIGARGWENEQVVDMLERSRRLRGLVEERNGLSDGEVGALLHGARALLLPSLAEGFGLPLAEALASGVPAICSDIPVFREVGRDVPEYLDPLDLKAWMDAVLDYCAADSPRRLEQLRRLGQWRAPAWVNHFTVVEQLLTDTGATSQPLLVADRRPSSSIAANS